MYKVEEEAQEAAAEAANAASRPGMPGRYMAPGMRGDRPGAVGADNRRYI